MLRSPALDYYHTNLRHRVQTARFEDLCGTTKKYFEGREYQRGLINRYNSITLGTVMNKPENTGKTTSECLQLLLTEMRHLKLGLPTPLQADKIFHTKLIQACQVNPACTYACCKPAEDIPGLIEELETSITTYEIQQKNDNNTLFTDRHYYRQTLPYPTSKQTSSRKPPSQETLYRQTTFRRPPGRQTIGKKRCFVCRNEGCWSSNHSKEEQEESKRRYRSKILQHYDRNTRQYITGYEGTEQEEETYDNEFEEETLDDTIQTLMTDSKSLPPIEEQPEQFFTSLEKVQNESAMEIVAKLADRAFTHALTGAKPLTKTEATKGVISPGLQQASQPLKSLNRSPPISPRHDTPPTNFTG